VPDEPTVAVLMDYQNIHLSGRDAFAPVGLDARKCLVHPETFAQKVIEARAQNHSDPRQRGATLAKVYVWRGVPSNVHQSHLYAAAQSQKANWSRNGLVEVEYRTLRYDDNGRNPREKGIDVLLAINLVRLAQLRQYATLILATHDSDLEPALEMAVLDGLSVIETAGWVGCSRLRVTGAPTWHTALDGPQFIDTRDRRNYWPGTT
jgi:uncharacterized LabA/DUF88 family protein